MDDNKALNELARARLASEIGSLVIAAIEAQAARDLALKKLNEKEKSADV